MNNTRTASACSSVKDSTSHTPHAVSSFSSFKDDTSRTPHAITSFSSFEGYASRTPQDILNAITQVYPCPTASGFERALWLCECRTAARWIANYTDAELKRQIHTIEQTGITSDTCEIIPIERQESRVDIDRLREKEPDVFAELVHIRASDAQKILGRQPLYQLARQKIGNDAIRDYETVNIRDIERLMPPQKSALYIDTWTKTLDWAVIKIETPEENP